MNTRKEEFLFNLSSGISNLNVTAETDNKHEDPRRWSTILKSLTLWLHWSHVEGYHPDDFADLSDQNRQKLTTSIAAFSEIARSVPLRGTATPEQSRQGSHFFTIIRTILEPTLCAFRASGRIA